MIEYRIYDMGEYPPCMKAKTDSSEEAVKLVEQVYSYGDHRIYAVDSERMPDGPRFITPEYVIYEALMDGSWFDMNKEQQDIALQACRHYHEHKNLENDE